MQIVIPMSGFGERFRKVGYSVPKPLIMIDGKTIIQHVVEMFPGEKDITFICNKDHLNEKKYRMGEILKGIAPKSKVIPINPHKLGPVHAVLQAIDALDLEPVVGLLSVTDDNRVLFNGQDITSRTVVYCNDPEGTEVITEEAVIPIQSEEPMVTDNSGQAASAPVSSEDVEDDDMLRELQPTFNYGRVVPNTV